MITFHRKNVNCGSLHVGKFCTIYILTVYKQGAEAVISLVLRMENRIQLLETCVQELEYHTKKLQKQS